MLGIGDQEFARLGELVGVPAGIQRSCPSIRSASRGSRTRRQIRTSICERTAVLLPIAAWVGRWVAAIRLTATARPLLATESAYSWDSSGSSAYSSVMMISAGLSGVGFPYAFSGGRHRCGAVVEFGYRVAE